MNDRIKTTIVGYEAIIQLHRLLETVKRAPVDRYEHTLGDIVTVGPHSVTLTHAMAERFAFDPFACVADVPEMVGPACRKLARMIAAEICGDDVLVMAMPEFPAWRTYDGGLARIVDAGSGLAAFVTIPSEDAREGELSILFGTYQDEAWLVGRQRSMNILIARESEENCAVA